MLGELIRDLRERARLTQVELADLAQLNRSWVSRVETNGILTPDPRKLRALARVLRVDADELFIAAGYLHRNNGSSRPVEEMSMEELTILAEKLWGEMARRASDADRSLKRQTSRGVPALIQRSA